MGVPYTFSTATTSIPLSQLDSNFATAITLGNTAVYLGNTTTSLGNLTLTGSTVNNPNVTNYTETVVAIGNSGTSQTLSLTNGTFQTVTMTGNCTFTMPTATAGKSFVLIVYSGAGSYTGTFTSVKWSGGSAPTLTTTASKYDLLSFFSDGTSWFGLSQLNFS
jgi:hypothetical protein